MDWHERFLQQASWTRELRRYVLERCNLRGAKRVLEVGCGTGAVICDLASHDQIHGLDIAYASLLECTRNAPTATLTCADARDLPYASGAFDIVLCHYLLLWIPEPLRVLREMRRVTIPSGYVAALAEPDYLTRVDEPASLAWLGLQQNEALRNQGADLHRGAELADLFFRAGIRIVECGQIVRGDEEKRSAAEWKGEWRVLEADLAGSVAPAELERLRVIDQEARARGQRILHVPTYFAYGQV